jgi:hypothetical protein
MLRDAFTPLVGISRHGAFRARGHVPGRFVRRHHCLLSALLVLAGLWMPGCQLMAPDLDEASFSHHEIFGHSDGVFPALHIYWNWVDNADQHILERKAPAEGTGFTELTWGDLTDFNDYGYDLPNGLQPGNTYIYRVRGYSKSDGLASEVFGPWSEEYSVTIPPFLTPTGLTATVTPDKRAIRLEWDSVNVEGVSYRIRRTQELDSDPWSVGTTQQTIFEDESYDLGRSYYYTVQAEHPSWGETKQCEPKAVDAPPLPAPVMHDAVVDEESGEIVLRWLPVEGRHDYTFGYRVYRSTSSPSMDGAYGPLFPNYIYPDYSNTDAVSREGDYVVYRDTPPDDGVTYYYKARASNDGTQAVYSALSPSYVSATLGTPAGTQSWRSIGSAAFARISSGSNPELRADGSTLYALFEDADDSAGRLTAMTADTTGGDWSPLGAPLSAGPTASGDVDALLHEGTLFAAFGDEGAESGGSPRLKVQRFTTTDEWVAVGSDDGVTVYDNDDAIAYARFGSGPAIVHDGTSLTTVYTTDSVNLVGSLEYDASDFSALHWTELDEDYWLGEGLSSFGNRAALDGGGAVIAGLLHGTSVEFRRHGSGGWESYAAPFEPSGPAGENLSNLAVWGFLIDTESATAGDTPYLLFSGYDQSLAQLNWGLRRWDGAGWEDLAVAAELSDVDLVQDAAMVPASGGAGLVLAVSYLDTGGSWFIVCLSYDAGSWSAVGSPLPLDGPVTRLDLALASTSAGEVPAILYSVGNTGTDNSADLNAVYLDE